MKCIWLHNYRNVKINKEIARNNMREKVLYVSGRNLKPNTHLFGHIGS